MIELKKIDESNFLDAFELELDDNQNNFVSHPIRSLAQAYVYYQQCTPFGIFYDNLMIGYLMVIFDYDTLEYNLWHMMIDKHHQTKGYGKQALEKAIDYIKTEPFGPSYTILLTCHKQNKIALHLYHSFGFRETGNDDEDEIELSLSV